MMGNTEVHNLTELIICLKHTKETLHKFTKNDKQLFFCEDNGKIIKSYDIKDYDDNATIYPILMTALEVCKDISFEQGRVNPAVANSLYSIYAGAFASKKSPTGYITFDGLPCKTPLQVKNHLKKIQEELSLKSTGPYPYTLLLIRIYEEARKFLSQCSEKDFENLYIIKIAESCREFEEVVDDK